MIGDHAGGMTFMRRKDRERDTDFAWRVFETAPYATLSTVTPEGKPCSIPISPARMGDTLVFHCAISGEKLDNITRNPSICLSAVSRAETFAADLTMYYDSAVLHGTAQIVNEPFERREAMRAITQRYTPENMAEFDATFEQYAAMTVIVRIKPDILSGKSNP